MAIRIELTVHGRLEFQNNTIVSNAIVKALGPNSEIRGEAVVNKQGKYTLRYETLVDNEKEALKSLSPIKLSVYAGNVSIYSVSYSPRTILSEYNITIPISPYLDYVLDKKTLELFRSAYASNSHSIIVIKKIRELVGVSISESSDKINGIIKDLIFHTQFVYNKKKIAKIYSYLKILNANINPSACALNIYDKKMHDAIISAASVSNNYITSEILKNVENNALRTITTSEKSSELDELLNLLEIASAIIGSSKEKVTSTKTTSSNKDDTVKNHQIKRSEIKRWKAKSSKPSKTSEQIKAFQKAYGLTESGVFDVPTVKKLRSVCFGRGNNKTYIKAPVATDVVIASSNLRINMTDSQQMPLLQKSLAYLGYKIDTNEFDKKMFGGTTREAILKFQKDRGIAVNGHYDRKTRAALSKELTTVNPNAVVMSSTHTIRGSVKDIDWKECTDMKVSVFMQDTDGKEILLGTRSVNKKGFYNIPIVSPIEKNTNRHREILPIIVKLYENWNPDKVIAKRDLIVKRKYSYVNFTKEKLSNGKIWYNGHFKGISEYEQIQKELKKYFGNNDGYESYLNSCYPSFKSVAVNLKFTLRQVACFIMAHRIEKIIQNLIESQQVNMARLNFTMPLTLENVTAETYYGLLRQNLPQFVDPSAFNIQRTPNKNGSKSDRIAEDLLDRLAEVDIDIVRSTLIKACNNLAVSRFVANNITSIIKTIKCIQAQRILTRKLEENDYTLSEILELANVPGDRFHIIALLYAKTLSLKGSFLTSIKEKISLKDNVYEDLRYYVSLSLIITNNLNALKKLRKDIGNKYIGRVALYTDIDWINKFSVNASCLPVLKSNIKVLWHEEYFINRLNELMKESTTSKPEVIDILMECMFLDDQSKRLNILDVSQIDSYQYKSSKGKELNRSDVKLIQRLRRMTSVPDIAYVMYQNNITNVTSAYFMSKNKFVTLMRQSKLNITDEESINTFKNIEFLYAQILSVYMTMRENVNSPKLIGTSPTVRNLLGSQDSYTVDHDSSLLSASAYLTDLLRFLGCMEATYNNKKGCALDLLFDRRPDIEHIKLSKYNTNNEIPYIDLVCYTLEECIYNAVNSKKIVEDDVQVKRNAISKYIYQYMSRNKVCKFNSYFSLAQEKVRGYMKKLGIERHIFMKHSGCDNFCVAAEFFGMSKDEANNYQSSSPATKDTIEGQKARKLMRVLGMEYTEMMEMLVLFGYGYSQNIYLSSSGKYVDVADVDQQEIIKLDPDTKSFSMGEIILFCKLMRKTSFTAKQLYNVLLHPSTLRSEIQDVSTAWANKNNRNDTLVSLWCFIDIMKRLNLSYDQTLELFGGESLTGLLTEDMEIVRNAAAERLIPNYSELKELTGQFAPLESPLILSSFLDVVDDIAKSGFTVEELLWMTGKNNITLLSNETLDKNYSKIKECLSSAQEESTAEAFNDSWDEIKIILNSWLGLSLEKLQYLFQQTGVCNSFQKNIKEWCRHLFYVALIDKRMSLSDRQFYVITSYAAKFEVPDFCKVNNNQWTFKAIAALIRLIAFDNSFVPVGEGKTYLEILTEAKNVAAFYENFQQLTGCNISNFTSTKTLAPFYNIDKYKSLGAFVICSKLLALNSDTISKVKSISTYSSESELAESLRQVIINKYGVQASVEHLREVENVIREKKRDVLVEWIVTKENVKMQNGKTVCFENADAISSYFLMDVEMNACQDTSEIRHAISSVQTFIQRCLLNLETGITITQSDKQDLSSENSWSQWNWMKNYRVWEANRKIFLFPENWLEPELRDDKTPFFSEMLNELSQNEATEENVENALLNYLNKLDEISHLEVCGIHHQQDDLNPLKNGYELDVWHVIGRTKSEPHAYYYRSYDENYGKWSAWEQIDVEFEGNQIVPVVYNRRLYLFWLNFLQKSKKPSSLPSSQPTTGNTEIHETVNYYEIQLSWTQKQKDGWSPRKKSAQKLIHPWARPVRSFTLKPFINKKSNRLLLDIYVSTSEEFNNELSSCNYSLYSNPRMLVSGIKANETYLPWHSSAFVFEGDVKEVLLKDLNYSTNSSLAYLKENFGIEVANISDLGSNAGPRLVLPDGMHLEGNRLVNNKIDNINLNRLNVPEVTEYHGKNAVHTSTLLTKTNENFEFLVSLQNDQMSTVHKNALMFYQDANRAFAVHTVDTTKDSSNSRRGIYRFDIFYHPYVDNFVRQVNKDGIKGLYVPSLQEKPWEYSLVKKSSDFFKEEYQPSECIKGIPYEDIDFTHGGAFGVYNWELFFHIPMTMACRLMQNQKFEDAMKWFHYIFNPIDYVKETCDSTKKYWITRPFRENAEKKGDNGVEDNIQFILSNISCYTDQIKAWKNNPFKPHIIAQYRTSSYQRQVVMKYIDNLISWADIQFREDTMESINEATLLYMLASAILGEKPCKVPSQCTTSNVCDFSQLREGLDAFGNSNVGGTLPVFIEDNIAIGETENAVVGTSLKNLPKLDVGYFSTPSNDMLDSYWDLVGDRLGKIRNSLNIDGVFRKLALYEPEIDPAALVRAAAAGVGVPKDNKNSSTSERGNYRYRYVVQKALDFCNDVRGFGEKLLSIIEKKDAETLSLLRQEHELILLNATSSIKKQQIDEAKESIKQMEKLKENAVIRKEFYESLEIMSEKELEAFTNNIQAYKVATEAKSMRLGLAIMNMLPSVNVGIEGWTSSPVATGVLFSGDKLAGAMGYSAQMKDMSAGLLDRTASMLSTMASYERRKAEWNLQVQTATKEIESIERQIAGAEIRLSISEKDFENHLLQIECSKAMDEAMKSRFTNQELYNWMLNQVTSVYFKAYQMAYDLAAKAEKCYCNELNIESSSIISNIHWDSLYKGLMAGDTLLMQIRQLEKAYIEGNKRKFEITKHISLASIAPKELLKLIKDGDCDFELPEELFDLDYQNHINRRIKNVSISIPCITSANSNINCTLTLVESTAYGSDRNKTVKPCKESVSIVTSSAQNDSGMFELNFNDERYLPFEGHGVNSKWKISMPKETNNIDRGSIADVILNICYTADNSNNNFKAEGNKLYHQLFNLKSDFSSDWHRFIHSNENGKAFFDTLIDKNRLPSYLRDETLKVEMVMSKNGSNFIDEGCQMLQLTEDLRLICQIDFKKLKTIDNLFVAICKA